MTDAIEIFSKNILRKPLRKIYNGFSLYAVNCSAKAKSSVATVSI
jgi:hypothetical protein